MVDLTIMTFFTSNKFAVLDSILVYTLQLSLDIKFVKGFINKLIKIVEGARN